MLPGLADEPTPIAVTTGLKTPALSPNLTQIAIAEEPRAGVRARENGLVRGRADFEIVKDLG